MGQIRKDGFLPLAFWAKRTEAEGRDKDNNEVSVWEKNYTTDRKRKCTMQLVAGRRRQIQI